MKSYRGIFFLLAILLLLGCAPMTVREGEPLPVLDSDKDPPSIMAKVSSPANGMGWHNTDVTVTFECSDTLSGVASCSSPVSLKIEGANQKVFGEAKDKSGNKSASSIQVSIDKTKPELTIDLPSETVIVHTATLTVTGKVTDTLSGFSEVSCPDANLALLTKSTPLQGIFTCQVSLSENLNTLIFHVSDFAGNISLKKIRVDYAPVVHEGEMPTPQLLPIPTIIPDKKSDLPQSPYIIATGVPIPKNTISNTASSTDTFPPTVDKTKDSVPPKDSAPPIVQITSPKNLSVVNARSLTIQGTVNKPNTTVTVNGIKAIMTGLTFSAAEIPLKEGSNLITVLATDAFGNVGTASILATLDPVSPLITACKREEARIS